MELKPLAEVDLREAIGPINRAVTGHFLPSVRTASQLRERAALGLLDMKLSRCAFIGRDLAGTCLVERVDERAHLDAIGVDPLSQQRGVGHALLESACVAAEATGVRRFTAEVSDSDAASLATLQSAGFKPHQQVSRWMLQGDPTPLTLPEVAGENGDFQPGQRPMSTLGLAFARKVELGEALSFLQSVRAPDGKGGTDNLPFAQQPEVLKRMQGKLCALLLLQLESHQPILGAAIIERDRHQLMALGGDSERLPPLVALLLTRYGITHAESVQKGDPAVAALGAAGMVQVAMRNEVLRLLP